MEKKDIALKQLRAAARHYNNCEYVCSITLSGAAEEILGKIAEKRTKSNMLKGEIEYLRGIYHFFSWGNPTDAELAGKINKVKNELKHNHSGINEWVEADFEHEAAMLFCKAVKNYFEAYDELPNDRIINRLFDRLTL